MNMRHFICLSGTTSTRVNDKLIYVWNTSWWRKLTNLPVAQVWNKRKESHNRLQIFFGCSCSTVVTGNLVSETPQTENQHFFCVATLLMKGGYCGWTTNVSDMIFDISMIPDCVIIDLTHFLHTAIFMIIWRLSTDTSITFLSSTSSLWSLCWIHILQLLFYFHFLPQLSF